jgi:hypothetical protein
LADALAAALNDRNGRDAAALRLQARLRASFSMEAMTDAIIDGYREILARRNG